MKLTAKELRLVQRLRKYERQWRYTRWVLVAGGLALIGVWAWMLYYVSSSTQTPGAEETAGLLRAYAYPKVLFGMIIGAIMIGFALRDWWGSATRVLLLRLLEDHEPAIADSGRNAEPAASNGGPATQSGNSAVSEGPPSVS
jgi:hypothetical protein